MNLELTHEQLAYLASLKKKSKQMSFLLEALLENVLNELPINDYTITLNNKTYSVTAPFYLDETTEASEKFLEFDKLEEESFEKQIDYKLLLRGFSNATIVNNRGLIGALIEEMQNLPNRQELEKAFNASREYHHVIDKSILKNKLVYTTFEDYYKTLEK